MKEEIKISKQLLWVSYIYLALPLLIFVVGWCRWYIGIPIAIVCCVSIWLSIKKRKFKTSEKRKLSAADIGRIVVIIAIIFCWVGLSGIGGFSFQNSDHKWRSAIFEMLLSEKWPVIYEGRGLVYYLGFWLPAALIGKHFGAFWGNIALCIWAILGVSLIYALICTKRKRIVIWPLLILICFSGMDIIGCKLIATETVKVIGTSHLEWWANHFQYSSNTTQLYWVFNQAIPTWLAVLLMFMDEHPKNLVFLCSLIMLTSTLPFIGMLPFVLYYMYKRCEWQKCKTVMEGWKQVWKNWVSFQNLVGGGCIGIISFFYLMGNVNFQKIFIKLQGVLGNNTQTVGLWIPWICIIAGVLGIFVLGSFIMMFGNKGILKKLLKKLSIVVVTLLIVVLLLLLLDTQILAQFMDYMKCLFLFFLLEMGILMICLRKEVEDKFLFRMTVLLLCVIPFIKVGSSIDFCMRASIPALFIIMMWCMDMLEKKKRDLGMYILVGCLLIGAITPLHELYRSIQGTIQGVSIEVKEYSAIIYGDNFSGTTDNFFWKYIAKNNF